MPENGEEKFRIAIICGKLGDVDGVSLEVDKWIGVLSGLGHEVFAIAGSYGRNLNHVPQSKRLILERLSFSAPQQQYYEKLVFPFLSKHPPHLSEERKKEIVNQLETEGAELASIIFEYIQENSIDVIIGENTNAMPMTLLAGMAVYKLATERRVATIFHHHDFWWERSRFSQNHIEPLLSKIMPPAFLGLEHVVISTYAAHVLSCLKRVRPNVIPNCEDFNSPVTLDDYNRDLRRDLGFKEDDILIVQPTRIVRRKRIEDSVALVGKLLAGHPELRGRVRFIISLYQGDEPDENYVKEIKNLALLNDVPLHFISPRVASVRTTNEKGEKIYTNRDVLANADLVTYLPVWEGFGNALLEAVAAKVPLVITEYLVYKTDIKVSRLKNIEIRDQYDKNGMLIIPDRVIGEIARILTDPRQRQAMVDWNFNVAKQEFGLDTLKRKLRNVLEDYGDEIRASRKRIRVSKTFYSV